MGESKFAYSPQTLDGVRLILRDHLAMPQTDLQTLILSIPIEMGTRTKEGKCLRTVGAYLLTETTAPAGKWESLHDRFDDQTKDIPVSDITLFYLRLYQLYCLQRIKPRNPGAPRLFDYLLETGDKLQSHTQDVRHQLTGIARLQQGRWFASVGEIGSAWLALNDATRHCRRWYMALKHADAAHWLTRSAAKHVLQAYEALTIACPLIDPVFHTGYDEAFLEEVTAESVDPK